MKKASNGFVVEIKGWRSQKLSFQLTPTGVRYYIVDTVQTRFGSKEIIRDISTQYNSIPRLLHFKSAPTELAKARVIEHVKKFYPEFCIPDHDMHAFAWAAFPMLGAAMKSGKLAPPIAVNLQVASGLRAFSAKDMVLQMFGESPRQHQAAASQSMIQLEDFVNIDNLTMASLLRGYLPPNEMTEVLKMDFGQQVYARVQQIDKQSANAIRLLLRRFRPQRIMRLIQSVSEGQATGTLLRDAALQYAIARREHPEVVMDLDRQFKDVRELHEVVTREYRKLKNPDREITYGEGVQHRLDDIQLPNGAKLIYPKSTHELIGWGDTMNNCIYSYGRDAADGSTLLLALLDAKGEMTTNIMVRGKNVVQCYGKSNTRCEDVELIEALFDGLIEEEIINPENDYTIWAGGRRVLHW